VTGSDSTGANVEVASSIVLSGLTPSFVLSGIPDLSGKLGVVTFNVQTDYTAGCAVIVQSQNA
jgi:hypothetical protein